MLQPTSLAADKASKPRRQRHFDLILQAMEQLPGYEGTADAIAAFCPFDKTEVSRRMDRLLQDSKVINTGRRGWTNKKCTAIIWRLIKEPQTTVQAKLFN